MRKKWKLCVMSGAIMVFAVLATLILAQNVMSSADGKEMEFQLIEGQNERLAEEITSQDTESFPKSSSGAAVEDSDQFKLVEGTRNPEETNCVTTVTTYKKEKATLGERIASYAQVFQGVRYVYGGTDLPKVDSWTYSFVGTEKAVEEPDKGYLDAAEKIWDSEYGVDASGFVMKVFEKFDIKLPRTVKEQAQQGTEVKIKDIKPGDIIFYGASNAKITHCGIYTGEDKVLHVSARTKVVKFSDMNYRRIAKVVRVVEE